MTTRPGPPLSGLTVLIVEDEFLIAIEAQRIAEEAGASVILAASLMQARQILASSRFDVALLDLRLGPEDAAPLARELLALNVPLVIATGFDTAMPAGVPVVPKPYRDTDLLAAIARALGRKA